MWHPIRTRSPAELYAEDLLWRALCAHGTHESLVRHCPPQRSLQHPDCLNNIRFVLSSAAGV